MFSLFLFRDAVESNAVLQAIDALSSSFEDQLTEKVTHFG